MVNDSISNFLTQIRNSISIKNKFVIVPETKITLNITKILKNEGFIENFIIFENQITKSIKIFLKYTNKNNKSIITKLIRISKPGLRNYISTKNKNKLNIFHTLDTFIISTSKGIMTNHQAKILKIGGEILCLIK